MPLLFFGVLVRAHEIFPYYANAHRELFSSYPSLLSPCSSLSRLPEIRNDILQARKDRFVFVPRSDERRFAGGAVTTEIRRGELRKGGEVQRPRALLAKFAITKRRRGGGGGAGGIEAALKLKLARHCSSQASLLFRERPGARDDARGEREKNNR